MRKPRALKHSIRRGLPAAREIATTVVALASWAVIVAGCSSGGDYDCPPGHTSCSAGSTISDRLPCPTGGLGKADFEGVAIADQLAFYASYNCSQPQICPDQGGRVGAYPIDPKSEPTEASFLLTNCSTGGEKLVIDKVVVYGDARCFFTDVTDNDIQDKAVAPGQATAVRTTYKPTTAGEDHAELRVFSNAENYPVLKIRVCSTAYEESAQPEPATADGGVPSADAAAAPVLECKAQSKLVGQCHNDPPEGAAPAGGDDAGPTP